MAAVHILSLALMLVLVSPVAARIHLATSKNAATQSNLPGTLNQNQKQNSIRRGLAVDSTDGAADAIDESSGDTLESTLLDDAAVSGFSIIAVGSYGGIDQSFVTSFLLQGVSGDNTKKTKTLQRSKFVSLDGGTTVSGIQAAVHAGSFQDIFEQDLDYTTTYSQNLTETGYIFLHGVQAYLLSHPHQDHNVGLTIAATDDLAGGLKPVFGTEFTTSTIQTDMWNWKVWPNFGASGVSPLNTYNVTTVQADGRSVYDCPPDTHMSFRAFPLSHGSYPSAETADDGTTSVNWQPYPSTAYLMEYHTSGLQPKVLFFGDTGADSISGTTYVRDIWETVAPYVADGSLHAILFECSYLDSQPDNLLFGHLKPKLFVQELVVLRDLVALPTTEAANEALSRVQIIVEHIKPSSSLFQSTETTGDLVMQELQHWADVEGLSLNLIQPMPGHRYDTY